MHTWRPPTTPGLYQPSTAGIKQPHVLGLLRYQGLLAETLWGGGPCLLDARIHLEDYITSTPPTPFIKRGKLSWIIQVDPLQRQVLMEKQSMRHEDSALTPWLPMSVEEAVMAQQCRKPRETGTAKNSSFSSSQRAPRQPPGLLPSESHVRLLTS